MTAMRESRLRDAVTFTAPLVAMCWVLERYVAVRRAVRALVRRPAAPGCPARSVCRWPECGCPTGDR